MRLKIDERPLDMDAERAGNMSLRLARGRERFGEDARRVGHDRGQEAGHAGAPMRRRDCGDSLDRRLSVEQHAAAAVDLPVDEARRENSAAEIHLLSAAGTVLESGERKDRRALDNERPVVVQPFAVEQARPVENLHCAVSLCGAMTPPTNRIAPSVAW